MAWCIRAWTWARPWGAGLGLLLDAGLRQGPWVGAGVAFAVAALLAQWIAVQARRADPVAAAPARS